MKKQRELIPSIKAEVEYQVTAKFQIILEEKEKAI